MSKETDEAFLKRKEEHQAAIQKRMENIYAKITLGMAQFMAAIKKLPLERRVEYAMEILSAEQDDEYDEDGKYIGDNPEILAAQQEIEDSNSKIVEDLPGEKDE